MGGCGWNGFKSAMFASRRSHRFIVSFQWQQPSEMDASRHKQLSSPFRHFHLVIFFLFGQVTLAHGHVVVDGPLHPPRPLAHWHATLVAFGAVVDLLAAGVESHWRHEITGVVPLPMRHGLWRVRCLTLCVCEGRRCAIGASIRSGARAS
jgi:hypothetical protein